MFCQKAKGWRVVLLLNLLLFVLSVGITGCGTVPPTVIPTQSPIGASIDATMDVPDFLFAKASDALPALIQAERQAAIQGDLALLALLWAEDARIVDGRNTTITDDDYVWASRAAILDRYIVAVFPNPPPPLAEPLDLIFEYDGAEATALNAIDRWTFVRAEGRWWLSELIYSYK